MRRSLFRHKFIIHPKKDFKAYISACRRLLLDHSKPQDPLRENRIEAGLPFEGTPDQPTHRACLFFHGLYDTPFTMRDIANRCQAQGFLTRGILLPGHGTKAAHLHTVRFEDWQSVVRAAVETLPEDIREVHLVGFSTGAALAVDYATHHPGTIASLTLLAPAIQIYSRMAFMLPWVNRLHHLHRKARWLKRQAETDYARYCSFSINGGLQVYRLTQQLRKNKLSQPLPPMMMVLTDIDEVISSKAAIGFFNKHSHPLNKAVVYSTHDPVAAPSNITYRPAAYPEQAIMNFSHLSLPTSHQNTHYGIQGDYQAPPWWLGKKDDRPHVTGAATIEMLQKYYVHRLMYNPDFDFMANEVMRFLTAASEVGENDKPQLVATP